MTTSPDEISLSSDQTVYEAMVRARLLGSISDAPADLSTNPAYMEGFGEQSVANDSSSFIPM